MTETFPQSFGEYTLIKKIGGGAMSDIYQALAPRRFNQTVAIKRLKPKNFCDAQLSAMLESEATTLGDCSHPNLVMIYDFAVHDGSPYLVLEYIDGLSLHQLHDVMVENRSHLVQPVVCWIIRQVAAALHYLHTRQILHTDLASRNVLIGRHGHVKLIDFSAAQSELNLEKTGSPESWCPLIDIPPERARGESFDERADVFQLGAVLYWHLAGRSPFGDKTGYELFERIKTFQPSEEIFFGKWNPTLKEIVRKSLAGDPKDRYPSALEFEKVLGRYSDREYPDFNPIEIGRFLESISVGVP